MEELLGLLLYLGVIIGLSICLTSLLCRFFLFRHRQPRWWIAFFIGAALGALAVFGANGTDLFRPTKWEIGVGNFPFVAWSTMWFALVSVPAFITAWYVVAHYKDKFEEANGGDHGNKECGETSRKTAGRQEN